MSNTTYLLADDDSKEIIIATQDPVELIATGLDRFAQTKHDLTVHSFESFTSKLLIKESFEDFVIKWKHETV